ncbi:hypothetical protein [Tranquillimonas rosea]|uniref:hypothetical protein n=1 Tax=Tranquillimonas rosea TaxID=641238 RepID=UPI003BAAE558
MPRFPTALPVLLILAACGQRGMSVPEEDSLGYMASPPAASPDFAGRDAAYRPYAPRIREGLLAPANFAETHSIVTAPCGEACVVGFVVDRRDGEVFPLPVGGAENPALSLTYSRSSSDLETRWFEGSRTCREQTFSWTGSGFRSRGRPSSC